MTVCDFSALVWHDLNVHPGDDLVAALSRANARGAHVVVLCYRTYPRAYAGLLDGKRASTHWMAEQDFGHRFPRIKLDVNALYVDDDKLITSAGTGAGLDCCLYLVREYYGARVANKVARTMVIPPHREGGRHSLLSNRLPHRPKTRSSSCCSTIFATTSI